MEMKIVGEMLHTQVTIAVKVLIRTDMLVHVFSVVFHHVMELKGGRAASCWLAVTGEGRIDHKERQDHYDEKNMDGLLHNCSPLA